MERSDKKFDPYNNRAENMKKQENPDAKNEKSRPVSSKPNGVKKNYNNEKTVVFRPRSAWGGSANSKPDPTKARLPVSDENPFVPIEPNLQGTRFRKIDYGKKQDPTRQIHDS